GSEPAAGSAHHATTLAFSMRWTSACGWTSRHDWPESAAGRQAADDGVRKVREMPQRIAVWYEDVHEDYLPLVRTALEGQGLEVREFPHWGDLYDACRHDAPEFILLDASLDPRSEVWSTLDLLLLHTALVKTAVIVASSDFTNRDLATYL